MNFFSRFSDWYFTKRALPYWCILLIDSGIVLTTGLLGTYLSLGGGELASHFWSVLWGLVLCLPVYIIGFRTFHTYNGIIRFSSYIDLFHVAEAVFSAGIIMMLVGLWVELPGVIFPKPEVFLLMMGLGTLLMWILRLIVKASYESIRTDKAVPVAIYGTQAGGIAIANGLRAVNEKQFALRAFISDREERKGSYLLGKPVFFNAEGISERILEENVKVLLVSPLKSDALRNNQPMVDEFTKAGIRIMMMPAAEEWDGKSDLTTQQLHEVDIEDLLPRDKIEVDLDAIGRLLKDKVVMVTGAAGSIGYEMSRQVAKFHPKNLVLIDQAETPMHTVRLHMANHYPGLQCETIVSSISNQTKMEAIFKAFCPDYVFHAAAYKHVPMMEDNPAEAVQNNIYGTRVIADLAVKYGTKKFVMISTDKAVNPTNVMGCSKRICEIYCQALNKALVELRETGNCEEGTRQHLLQVNGQPGITQFVTTRFGNVLGSNGSVIPIFKKQIAAGGPVTVTHPDIIRFFMLIPEACRLVLEAGTMGNGGEIFIFDMGKPVRIADLAQRMIDLSGAKNIEIKFTGLRHGEKLYEEVLNDAELTKETPHPKIKVSAVREYPYALALKNEEELHEISYTYDDMKIVAKMKQIVPEYKSKVSKYEILDKD